ncbi:Bifunctional protein ThiO/ThiG [Gracilariopsis chorda]|uniref:Bifunctional protein ThiO/ThiG n=1 Tax=Gracilariopsis chorda TaxID=448386 RepID=A0A2V3J3M6_9FLOR|nr:Bifunctional protein ThiO/ThiG [Gracilariopsis chorda]|eukprot:PXF49051.1 Bifunctional protein ThiO/ThiG [Gracilariopsis chorda]
MSAFSPPATSFFNSSRQFIPSHSPRSAPAGTRRDAAPLHCSATPDIVVVGGGAAGLATAYELVQRGVTVRLLTCPSRRPAAFAAAGMLAPSAELLDPPMVKLATQSLHMYPNFVQRLQSLTGHDVRYIARADFLAPSFEPISGPDVISGDAVRFVEPALSDKVAAVRRHPFDAQVDNRRLTHALRDACERLGVIVDEIPVRAIVTSPTAHQVAALQTATGELISAAHFVIAAGSWTRTLLPMLPIRPVKGQLISLAPTQSSHPILNHVLYGPKVYIVPKNDLSEYYIGATVEDVGFDVRMTPSGVKRLIDGALEVVPSMADYELREMWAGLRPATPDEKPIFGPCTFDNVSVVTGLYRNGILLTPIASTIAAAYALGDTSNLPPDIQSLLPEFLLDRFYRANNTTDLAQADESTVPPSATHIKAPTKPQPPQQSSKEARQPPQDQIKLWRKLPDGTSEPIYPPNWKGPENVKPRSIASDTTAQKPDASKSPLNTNAAHSEEAMAVSTTVAVPNPESISGENDAYDDVLSKRGEGMEESQSKALAANRAFGREKSSLQRDDGPVLSISEEEVMLFDAAAKRGYQDMDELEKCFDSKHESVRSTENELHTSDVGNFNATASVNGVEYPCV